MITKILKLLVPLVALLAGAAVGFVLKPPSDTTTENMPANQSSESDPDHGDASSDSSHDTASDHNGHGAEENGKAWLEFSRQFFVPLVRQGDGAGVIIMSISLETDSENLSSLNDQEIRLRDIILRQLLIAANTGRFDGNFTTEGRIRGLRKQILTAVQEVVGQKVTAVLISDLLRQDE